MAVPQSFLNLFKFSEALAGYVAVETECYVTDLDGVIVPKGHDLGIEISRMFPEEPEGTFGGDLPRCQLEYKTGPTRLEELLQRLSDIEMKLRKAEELLGFGRIYEGFVPGVPLDVSPVERYERIAKVIPEETLRSACEVAATHIHVGMPNMETAIEAYNRAIGHLDYLLESYSTPKRLETYAAMAGSSGKNAHIPPQLDSVEDLFRLAERLGFTEDLKSWWGLVRITRWGTVEFRMADSTNELEEIDLFAMNCLFTCFPEKEPKKEAGCWH